MLLSRTDLHVQKKLTKEENQKGKMGFELIFA